MFLFIIAFTLIPKVIGSNFLPYIVIWNVGQGQWVTYIEPAKCIHIDMGGEFYPLKVNLLCEKAKNFLHVSHWDWDHYRFIKRFQRRIAIQEKTSKPLQTLFAPDFFKDKNTNSKITWIRGVLLTGDSTKKAEAYWAQKVPNHTKVLIVPHHGSNTSSSDSLLRAIDGIKMAIVSARQAKYGHPHAKVRERYLKYKIPLLTTESWGHIRIDL